MPGPGGGAHGGGGFRGGGGSFGGGFRGGFNPRHFTPPPRHRGGFHGPHFGGGWYRRPHYGGGGCFSGISAILIVGIVVLFLGFCILTPSNTNITINNSDTSKYDENLFQDYADKQYRDEFGSSTAYEDNILLVFLTEDENYYDYYYIAWVGDHIETEINYLFGNENTEFGLTVTKNINTSSYKYSLDSNIAHIVEDMQNEIIEKSLDSSFSCDDEHLQVKSHLTNKTTMDLSNETVNSALQNFTEATGIPIVVVVDDIDDVFESSNTQSATVSNNNIRVYIVVGVAIVVIVIAVSVSYSKKRKKELENDNT